MKKIYLTTLLSLFVVSLWAQNNKISVQGVQKSPYTFSKEEINKNFQISKSQSNFNNLTLYYPQGSDNFGIHKMNKNWAGLTPNDLFYNTGTRLYLVVDSLLHVIDSTAYSWDSIGSVTIDSIGFTCNALSSDGQMDSLIFSIVEANPVTNFKHPKNSYSNTKVYYPTDNVLHADTFVFDTLFPGTQYAKSWFPAPATIKMVYPNYKFVPSTDKRFGLKVEYIGAQTDTFGYVVAFIDGGQCNLPTQTLPSSAVMNPFYPYVFWYNLSVSPLYGDSILPSQTNGDPFRDQASDCDGSGSIDAGYNEEDRTTQAVLATFYLTVESFGVGVQENELSRTLTIYPNPNNGIFTVKYNGTSSKNLNINLYDMQGKEVYKQSVKTNGLFQQNIDISKYPLGVYLVKIQSDKSVVTKRINITR